MKKNRLVILLFILTLLALLVVVYVVVSPKLKKAGNTATEVTTAMLADYVSADMTALSYTNGGETLSFVYDGIWYLDGDRDFPVKQDKLASMSSAISVIPMARKFNANEVSDADSGLQNPAYTISASYKDSSKVTYHVGNFNSFNNNYYFSIDGDGSVYMIPSGLTACFDYTLLKLAAFDTLPTLTVDAIKSYDVVNAVTSFNITDAGLLEKLTALYFNECVAYKPDSKTLDSLGLGVTAPTMTVHYTVVKGIAADESSVSATAGVPVDYDMTFHVGSLCENDDTLRYVQYNDSPIIYSMDAKTMETLLQMG